jgi:hypothetical protein
VNRARLLEAVAEEAAVREVLDAFPGATIVDIREGRRQSPDPVAETPPADDEDWPPRANDDDDLTGHLPDRRAHRPGRRPERR